MSVQIVEIASFLSKAQVCKSPGSGQTQHYWLKFFPTDQRLITKKTLIFKGRNHKRYRLARNRNNLFATKISRQQVSQDLPTHHMPNNHVQDLKYNSHKNLHNSGEQNLLLAEQKVCHLGSKRYKDQLMTSKAIYKD